MMRAAPAHTAALQRLASSPEASSATYGLIRGHRPPFAPCTIKRGIVAQRTARGLHVLIDGQRDVIQPPADHRSSDCLAARCSAMHVGSAPASPLASMPKPLPIERATDLPLRSNEAREFVRQVVLPLRKCGLRRHCRLARISQDDQDVQCTTAQCEASAAPLRSRAIWYSVNGPKRTLRPNGLSMGEPCHCAVAGLYLSRVQCVIGALHSTPCLPR
jgi:hypothetical protein